MRLTDGVLASSELTETSGVAERMYSAENLFDGDWSIWLAENAPVLVTENDWHLYFGLEYPAEGAIELAETMDTQYFDFPLSDEQKSAVIRNTMNRFLSDHPQFANSIERDLGLGVFDRLSESEREEYLHLIRAAFAVYCVRLLVAEIHPGDSYDNTCISDVEVEFH